MILRRPAIDGPASLFGLFLALGTPAYSRVFHAGEDLGAMVARSASVLGVAAGFFLAPLAGCGAALIPLVFGSKWAPAAGMLPGCCAALCIGGPLGICIQHAMFAAGDAKTPLRSIVIVLPPRLALSLFAVGSALLRYRRRRICLAAGAVHDPWRRCFPPLTGCSPTPWDVASWHRLSRSQRAPQPLGDGSFGDRHWLDRPDQRYGCVSHRVFPDARPRRTRSSR